MTTPRRVHAGGILPYWAGRVALGATPIGIRATSPAPPSPAVSQRCGPRPRSTGFNIAQVGAWRRCASAAAAAAAIPPAAGTAKSRSTGGSSYGPPEGSVLVSINGELGTIIVAAVEGLFVKTSDGTVKRASYVPGQGWRFDLISQADPAAVASKVFTLAPRVNPPPPAGSPEADSILAAGGGSPASTLETPEGGAAPGGGIGLPLIIFGASAVAAGLWFFVFNKK